MRDHANGIDRRDKKGRTLLIAAAAEGNIGKVKRLLAEGADPNLTDSDNNTALIAALKRNAPEIAEMLLENRNISIPWDTMGRTLLEYAARNVHIRAMQMIANGWLEYARKAHDRSVHDDNEYEMHPLTFDILRNGNLSEIIRLFCINENIIAAPLHYPEPMEDSAWVCNHSDAWVMPLHYAALKGDLCLAALLLALGADVYRLDSKGHDAHQIAFEHGYDEIIKLLKAFDKNKVIATREVLHRASVRSKAKYWHKLKSIIYAFWTVVTMAIIFGIIAIAIVHRNMRENKYAYWDAAKHIHIYACNDEAYVTQGRSEGACFIGSTIEDICFALELKFRNRIPTADEMLEVVCIDPDGRIIGPCYGYLDIETLEMRARKEWTILMPAEDGWMKGNYSVIVKMRGNELVRNEFSIH
jgi:ankyrin repeat protein